MNFFDIEKTAAGIAIIWFDQQGEKVNKISPLFIESCADIFTDIATDDTIKAVILTSRKKDFVAGADLDAIYPITTPGQWAAVSRQAHTLLNQMEYSEKPIIAAMHGATMGGGLEMALACHYRIASNAKHTVFALPEVKLGLLPGGGGTQRLPELVGIPTALEMMLTGKNIYARKAKKIGLIDKLVNEYSLLRVAKKLALDMAGKKIVRKDKRSITDKLLGSNPVSRSLIFDQARKKVSKQTQGNYPAPYKIIECVEMGTYYGREVGIETEVRHFDELVVHPVSKQLMNLFFAITNKKKNPMQTQAKPVKKLAMLGAGFMGAGIAEVSADKNISVIIKDIKTKNITQAKRTIWKSLSKKIKKKVISEYEASLFMNRIKGQLDYQHFNTADIVVEAVFEDLDLKQKILAEVEANTHDQCIFATNTSALPISAIAAKAKRPQNVIGMHYFSPVPKMPLLEIVVTKQTAPWVTATALALGIEQGKTCIVVKDGPGFYTTRILAPFLNEALLMLEENGDVLQIDKCAQQLGYPVGPLTLMDEVGIDVGAHIMGGELMQFFKSRGSKNQTLPISDAPIAMAKAGYFGRKNKKGFYQYDKKGKKKKGLVNETIYGFFGGDSEAARHNFKDKLLRQRLMMIMTNEAARCLEEGIIQNPLDGDIGAIFGLGYPPFTGGPFRYLDTLGCDEALKRLEKLTEKYGIRFAPANIIQQYATSGKKFYP